MKSESIRQAAARDRTGARDGRARVTPRTQFGSQPAGAAPIGRRLRDWSTSAEAAVMLLSVRRAVGCG